MRFSPKNPNFMFSPKFEKLDNLGFLGESKNARAEISRKTHRRMPRDLSYETDSGPITKLKIDPFLDPLKMNIFFKASKPKLGHVPFAIRRIAVVFHHTTATHPEPASQTYLVMFLCVCLSSLDAFSKLVHEEDSH